MARKFHVSDRGIVDECRAGNGPNARGCPFGGVEDHFPTRWEAMRSYEDRMAEVSAQEPLRKNSSRRGSAKVPHPHSISMGNLKKGMVFSRSLDATETAYRVLEDVDPGSRFGKVRTDRGLINFGQNWQHKTLLLRNPPEGYRYTPVAEANLALAKEVAHSYVSSHRVEPRTTLSEREVREILGGDRPAGVLASRSLAGEIVELKVDSFASASRHRKTMEANGLMVEVNSNSSGNWVRVQPMPQEGEYVDSRSMLWNADTNSFVEEASSLMAGGLPRFIRSARSGEMVELREPIPSHDSEGEITHWTLYPYNPSRSWKLVIFND